MENQKSELIPIDPFEALNITLNPDGTLTRHSQPLNLPWDNTNSNSSSSVVSTDIPLNLTRNTYIRVFQPHIRPAAPKLPLIIFFHGGGFIIFNASSPPYHECCVQMARDLPAVVLSVDYTLAPEYRLPSAYEDAMEALLWVKTHAFKGEYKFFEFVDFSKCFVMGSSSGANITYQVGLQALKLNLQPLIINGLIMVQPFFGGVQRSGSELRLANDKVLPLPVTDLMWELALPVGADRDHEYCNRMDGRGETHSIDKEEMRGLPRCYVRGHVGDPLVDRQKEFVKMLEEYGICVVGDFSDDGYHACELFDLNKGQELVKGIKGFISSS